MTFKVNQALIGKKVLDKNIGFSFSPPKSCLQMDEDIVEKIRQQLKTKHSVPNSYLLEPYLVFLNEKNQSVCLVSILPGLTDADSAITQYQQAIDYDTEDRKTIQTVFLHNGFQVYQSLITASDKIQFKLVIPQKLNKSFQIDYIIPKTIYLDEVEAIESSIGTLLKL